MRWVLIMALVPVHVELSSGQGDRRFEEIELEAGPGHHEFGERFRKRGNEAPTRNCKSNGMEMRQGKHDAPYAAYLLQGIINKAMHAPIG